MECKTVKRNISPWIDGELESTKKADIEQHITNCHSCQRDVQAFRTLNSLLEQAEISVEPSRNFDAVFWGKVDDRQKTPWLVNLLNNLEALIPMPNLKQAVAFATLAFFIGNLGGAVSAMNSGASVVGPMASMKQLSALQEFKGIQSYSLAATYLRATQSEVSSK